MIKILFLFAILVFDLFAKEKLFFLPNDSKKFIEHFQQDVKSAHNSIIVVTYNFQSKDIYKLLKKKAQEDISITLIYDSKKAKDSKSKISKLCQTKNILCKNIDSKKQHIKLILIDNKIAYFGSANITKESFEENYELMIKTDDQKLLKSFEHIVNQIN